MGENGQWVKHTNFEQGVHTPFMLHIPNKTDKGIPSRSLVELLDVYPTLAESAGLPVLPTCPEDSSEVKVCTEGKSVLPLIDDPKLELREAAISQHRRMGLRMGYTMRTDRWRYTEWVQYERSVNVKELFDYETLWDEPKGVELYDHKNDPEENYNLADHAKYKDVATDLRGKLRSHCKANIFDVPRGGSALGLIEDIR